MRVLVRNKGKIPEDLKNKVEAVVGDVTNAKDVAKAVAGRDAVIVVLGPGNNYMSKQHICFLIFIGLKQKLMVVFFK